MAETLKKECLSFINRAVDHCLEMKERKDQNKRFAAIRSDLPIKPIKMTLTTAVFLFKDDIKSYVIKRVIVNEASPTQEEEISLALKHRNIINTFGSEREVFVNHAGESQTILWLYSEYLKEKVSQRTVDRNERIIRDIMEDVLTALVFLHDEMNMVHLDLKIANVMGQREKGKIVYKLIDFGYARNFNLEENDKGEVYIKNKSYGTFPYKSYEVVRKNIHGKASDIWCVGAIAWFLSMGETPFYKDDGEKDTVEFRQFIDGIEKHFFAGQTSSELKKFILTCMNRKRNERPTARDLLEHDFITGKKIERVKGNDSGFESDDTFTDSDLDNSSML
ncbi:hypothetical protein COBT_000369 [Conglomerata obtusa]